MESFSSTTRVYEKRDGFLLKTAEIVDSQRIATYYSQNREYLKPWEPERAESFFTEIEWSKKLIKLNELHQLGLAYYLLIMDEKGKQVLGTISFSNLSRFPFHACSVGYSLAQDHHGKGLMTRALKVAIRYMFSHQNMHRIMANYMPHNQRSEAVLKRLGFEREGLAKDYLLIDGQWQDHVLTALTNPDWKKTR